jgi:hypothetical protein
MFPKRLLCIKVVIHAHAPTKLTFPALPPRNLAIASPPHNPLQSQTLPNILPHNLLIIRPLLPPHARRIHVRRALIIRLSQHTHHAN